MPKALVVKHMAEENLGTLRNSLRDHGLRLKFMNFGREPEGGVGPMEKFDLLVLLGGPMGVYEMGNYPHLVKECKLVESAMASGVPVLGICLGAQILAHVLGAPVVKNSAVEAGWSEVRKTPQGKSHSVMEVFDERRFVFQMHQDKFLLPKGAIHLARSELCEYQAFCFDSRAFGFQFHLEANIEMLRNLLGKQDFLNSFAGPQAKDRLEQETRLHLAASMEQSLKVFSKLLQNWGFQQKVKKSTHGKA